jgi:hypothetical protein
MGRVGAYFFTHGARLRVALAVIYRADDMMKNIDGHVAYSSHKQKLDSVNISTAGVDLNLACVQFVSGD